MLSFDNGNFRPWLSNERGTLCIFGPVPLLQVRKSNARLAGGAAPDQGLRVTALVSHAAKSVTYHLNALTVACTPYTPLHPLFSAG